MQPDFPFSQIAGGMIPIPGLQVGKRSLLESINSVIRGKNLQILTPNTPWQHSQVEVLLCFYFGGYLFYSEDMNSQEVGKRGWTHKLCQHVFLSRL